MAKKTKKKRVSEETAAPNGTETSAASDDQTVESGPTPEETVTEAVPETPAEPVVKPSTALAGEAELAERKGTWTYTPEPPSATEPSATEETPSEDPHDASAAEDAAAAATESGDADAADSAPSDDTSETAPAAAEKDNDLGDPWAAKTEESATPAPAEPTPQPAPAPAAPPEQVVVRQGGFMSMLLGGVAAAALGFVAADYGQPGGLFDTGPAEPSAFETETRATLEAAEGRLAALEGQEPVDLTPLSDGLDATTARIDGLSETFATDLAAVSAALAETEAKLTELAQSAITESVSDTVIAVYEEAIAGYSAELTAMQESVAAQRAEIEELVTAATERESEAMTLAKAAQVQSAAAALIVQVESGEPYGAALEAYTAAGGAPVEAALSDLAAEGLPKLEGLQDSFPDAARAALAAARDPSADASDGAGGLGTFFARQLQVRSVTPREGTDPDAVLSRAEAAVRVGDLNTALMEIETLPDGARSALADWEATATLRRDALAAATALSASDASN